MVKIFWQDFFYLFYGHFLSSAYFGCSYVKKFWHAYCKGDFLQLCKEVLAQLLQALFFAVM